MGSLSGKHCLQTQQERQEVGDLANNPWAWWLILSERLNLSIPIPLRWILILYILSHFHSSRLTVAAFGDCSAAGILPTNSWVSLKFQTVCQCPNLTTVLVCTQFGVLQSRHASTLGAKSHARALLILRSPSVLSFHHQVSLDLEKTCDKNDAAGEFLSEMINRSLQVPWDTWQDDDDDEEADEEEDSGVLQTKTTHYRLQTCRSDLPESHRKSHLSLVALFHSFSFHLSTVYSSASCFMRLVCCFDWDWFVVLIGRIGCCSELCLNPDCPQSHTTTHEFRYSACQKKLQRLSEQEEQELDEDGNVVPHQAS